MEKKKIIFGIMSFVILFLVLVTYKESKVFEDQPKQEESMYAYYVNDEPTNEMPSKDSGLVLSSKSNCNNGVTISWDSSTWSAIVNYQNYRNESKRTKCNLYFESPSYLRKVTLLDANGMWKERENITKLIIQNELKPIDNAEFVSDESDKQNGSIMSYLVKNEDNATYTAYLQGNVLIPLNPNSSSLFYNFSKLESIEGMEYLDTSDVTNMNRMFYEMSSLTTLDLGNFDTSKVTNMNSMFYGMSSLISLNLSNFDTSKVTNMNSMFYKTSSLTDLDISNFNTSSVTNMGMMFRDMSSLTSLDVSNFDTAKVSDMGMMFYGMSSLISLNLSSFDTSEVRTMENMFYGMSSLTSLDVSNFDTSYVGNMSYMFYGVSNLTSLDLSNFNTSYVGSMSYMFYGMSSLTSLDLSNFKTSKVINMDYMFASTPCLNKVEYGSQFVREDSLSFDSMYSNSTSPKPTHESWNGVF